MSKIKGIIGSVIAIAIYTGFELFTMKIAYNAGYDNGRASAFDECTKELTRMDKELREKYPEVFKEKN